MLSHCDLFSGLAGFRTGLTQAGFATLGAVERDIHCVQMARCRGSGSSICGRARAGGNVSLRREPVAANKEW